MLTLQVVVPLVALTVLAYRLGLSAFRPALAVVSPVPLLAALVLGGVAVAAHAARWRVVMRGAGLRIGPAEALAEYYRSSALNTVLPGGVGGDVLRAWRQRTEAPQGWRPGAVSVLAERAVGACVLLSAVSVVMLVTAPGLATVAAALAVIAWAVARPSLRRLSRRDRVAVWGWSAVSVAALLALTAVVAAAVGVTAPPAAVAFLGVALLAGTAVPLNLGGWGPREAAGALAATVVGVSPAVGVAFAAGYGLLATVSVLPGFVMLGGLVRSRRLHRSVSSGGRYLLGDESELAHPSVS
jgi:glycosyltransferase 2 family protein